MKTIVYEKSRGLTDKSFSYCPGCTHGMIHKLVAESLVELDVLEKTVLIAPVGCAVMAYEFFNCDVIQAAHGRAPAVATGVKRCNPDKIVVTYQGDGDLASIGMGEIIHAAHRGENITVIFINNSVYGMTGGQMAPTTLIGQRTSTSVDGRSEELAGLPVKMAELITQVPSSHYVERVSMHNIPNIRKTKKAIKKAFENQIENKGFSFVEVLSSCNIAWNVTPFDALKYIEEKLVPYYPLGVYKDGGEAQ